VATVLEECNAEEQRSLVRFLWAKGLNAKDIHKEIFPVYVEKCLSRKAVQIWVENISLMMRKLKRGAEMIETTVKRLLCCGVRRTGKAK
jgi:hypothetical protein